MRAAIVESPRKRFQSYDQTLPRDKSILEHFWCAITLAEATQRPSPKAAGEGLPVQ